MLVALIHRLDSLNRQHQQVIQGARTDATTAVITSAANTAAKVFDVWLDERAIHFVDGLHVLGKVLFYRALLT